MADMFFYFLKAVGEAGPYDKRIELAAVVAAHGLVAGFGATDLWGVIAAVRDFVVHGDGYNLAAIEADMDAWATQMRLEYEMRITHVQADYYCCGFGSPYNKGDYIKLIEVSSEAFEGYTLYVLPAADGFGPFSFAAAASQPELLRMLTLLGQSLKPPQVPGRQGVLMRLHLYARRMYGFSKLLMFEHVVAQVLAQCQEDEWWDDDILKLPAFKGVVIESELDFGSYNLKQLATGDNTVLLLAMDAGNNSSVLRINDWHLRDVCPATGPDGQLTNWVKGRKTLQKRQDAQAFMGVFTTRLMLGPGDTNRQILTTVYDLVKDGLPWTPLVSHCQIMHLKYRDGDPFVPLNSAGVFQGRPLTGRPEQAGTLIGHRHSRGAGSSDEGGHLDWWVSSPRIAAAEGPLPYPFNYICPLADAADFLQREVTLAQQLPGFPQLTALCDRFGLCGFLGYMKLYKSGTGGRPFAEARVLFFGAAARGSVLAAAVQYFFENRGDLGRVAAAFKAAVEAVEQQLLVENRGSSLSRLEVSSASSADLQKFKVDVPECKGPIMLTQRFQLRVAPRDVKKGLLWDDPGTGRDNQHFEAKQWGVLLPLACMMALLFAMPDWPAVLQLDASRSVDAALIAYLKKNFQVTPGMTATFLQKFKGGAAVAEPEPKAQGGGGQL